MMVAFLGTAIARFTAPSINHNVVLQLNETFGDARYVSPIFQALPLEKNTIIYL